MSQTTDDPGRPESTIALSAREVPAPRSISPEAQESIARRMPPPPPPPDPSDVESWRQRIEFGNQMMTAMYAEAAARVKAEVSVEDAGVPIYVIEPPDVCRPGKVYLDVHGGALIMGGGECCRALGTLAADRVGLRTYAVDYRMPPEHPYPTPLDDCLAAYRWVLERHAPGDVLIGGGSAGANLAAATVLRARDERLPLPAGVILLTPELDLTESGDSFCTNLGLDTVLHRGQAAAIRLYAPGEDLRDPYLSPLFGDFGPGFPPTFLQAGTRDLFLSNAVLMHRALRRAGVAAELHVFEAMPHGGFGGAPEDADLTDEVRRFVAARWP